MAGTSPHVAVDNDLLCHILSLCVVVSGSSLALSSIFSWERGAPAGRPSPKNLSECLIIIPDQNRLAYPHGRGTQVPGWPEQQASQDIVGWRCGAQIDRGDFIALRRDQTMRLTCHRQRLGAPQLATRRHRFAHRNTPRLQKLRGSRTGRSALAVVIPIHRWRHTSPLMPL